MEPQILELSKKCCYVIYGNHLLINVPKKKLEECVQSFSSGLPVKGVDTFTMDGRFSISYAEKDDVITIGDANTPAKTINYENSKDKAAVLAWLKPYFEENGFKAGETSVAGGKLLMRGLGSVAFVLFIFGMLYAAEGSSTRNLSGKGRAFASIANALGTELILIIGGVCLLAAIIYTIRLVKKGDVQVTYSK